MAELSLAQTMNQIEVNPWESPENELYRERGVSPSGTPTLKAGLPPQDRPHPRPEKRFLTSCTQATDTRGNKAGNGHYFAQYHLYSYRNYE